ncbi:MAG: hypothetical protein GY853_00845 [PVC group bacterium]|nr:hypothetical protein [PVC group bacterium]
MDEFYNGEIYNLSDPNAFVRLIKSDEKYMKEFKEITGKDIEYVEKLLKNPENRNRAIALLSKSREETSNKSLKKIEVPSDFSLLESDLEEKGTPFIEFVESPEGPREPLYNKLVPIIPEKSHRPPRFLIKQYLRKFFNNYPGNTIDKFEIVEKLTRKYNNCNDRDRADLIGISPSVYSRHVSDRYGSKSYREKKYPKLFPEKTYPRKKK